MAKDRLNPLIFSFLTGDLGLRFQKIGIGKKQHYKDRCYFFEQKINKDTEYFLNKRIADYQKDEFAARIPLMFVTPSIVNDGRKLYISPQKISYMTTSELYEKRQINTKIKGVEFSRFFAQQDADSLLFLTALRMNATFPYITPNVILPTVPTMEIMDAGILDNFGVDDAVRFLYVFRDWIDQHTAGVVFICIRDAQKEEQIESSYGKRNLISYLFSPIADLVGNLSRLQDVRNDTDLEYAKSWLKSSIGMVEFQYQHTLNADGVPVVQPASLSWRLTEKESEGIKQMIHSKFNQNSIRKLKYLLQE